MISTEGNKIEFTGKLETNNYRNLLSAIYNRISKRGYEDLIIDLSSCTYVNPGSVIALCTQVRKYRDQDIDFKLTLPEKQILARLFVNTNWAHIIDPDNYQPSEFKGLRQVPTRQFFTYEEQNSFINDILDIILAALSGFSREDFAAIEWSINEIADNAITHSNSEIGGFMQLSTFQRNRKKVEYVICDAGIGIPATLRPVHPARCVRIVVA